MRLLLAGVSCGQQPVARAVPRRVSSDWQLTLKAVCNLPPQLSPSDNVRAISSQILFSIARTAYLCRIAETASRWWWRWSSLCLVVEARIEPRLPGHGMHAKMKARRLASLRSRITTGREVCRLPGMRTVDERAKASPGSFTTCRGKNGGRGSTQHTCRMSLHLAEDFAKSLAASCRPQATWAADKTKSYIRGDGCHPS